jgi:hypothetical protein
VTKQERKTVSRIKIENIPKMSQTAGKAGPLGIVSKEVLPNDQDVVEVSIGSWLSFTVPRGVTLLHP